MAEDVYEGLGPTTDRITLFTGGQTVTRPLGSPSTHTLRTSIPVYSFVWRVDGLREHVTQLLALSSGYWGTALGESHFNCFVVLD